MVIPRHFLAFQEFVEHTIVFQLQHKTVVCKLRRRSVKALSTGFSLHHVPVFLGLLCHCHHKRQHIIIKVISLRKAKQQLLLSSVDIVVSVLIVSISKLHYLYSYQFSINHTVFLYLSFFRGANLGIFPLLSKYYAEILHFFMFYLPE